MASEKYRAAVNYLSSSKVDYKFPNKGIEHAQVVLISLMKFANKNFKMYTGKLDISDSTFIKEFTKMVNLNITVEVLVDDLPSLRADYPAALNKAIELSKQHKKLSIRLASQEFKDDLVDNVLQQDMHFAVIDSTGYRLETDANNFKAICNFNEPVQASLLDEVFSKHFQKSSVIT